MPKVTKTNLRNGDIVIFQWNDDRWHTAVYVAGGGVQSGIAHCEGQHKGTAIDPLDPNYAEAKHVYAFRIPTANANALPSVMALVRAWAPVVVGPTSTSTNYGTPRGSAVLKDYDRNNPGTATPFEYDAFFRVFKWLDGRERFSRNRGTTCCAFVIACFQAGMMRYFMEQNQLLDYLGTIQHKLRDERATKAKPSHERSEEIFRSELLQSKGTKSSKMSAFNPIDEDKIKARRLYTNPGSKKRGYTDVDALWEEIKSDVCYLYNNQTTLQDILTDPLLCDAKFTYTHTLYERLRLDNDWTAVQ